MTISVVCLEIGFPQQVMPLGTSLLDKSFNMKVLLASLMAIANMKNTMKVT
uniref:Uncharacterized protein n=1 Tax=Rhizophora mucronata TaxID=61149 RepID=A0A2P2NM15_RHIMU